MSQVTELPHEFTGRIVNGEPICKWCSGTMRECALVFGPICEKRPLEQSEGVAGELQALPVRTEIVNVDTGERGEQSVEVPLELRDRILAALTPPPVTVSVEERQKLLERRTDMADFCEGSPTQRPHQKNVARLCRAAIAALKEGHSLSTVSGVVK